MWAGATLGQAAAREYRLRAVFECGKLDPQVGDTSVLAPFPLWLDSAAWDHVSCEAEALSREALDAEREMVQRPELRRDLALPRALRRALDGCAASDVDAGPRLSRFDFHWVRREGVAGGVGASIVGSEGAGHWQISEVNADVPGGLIEAGPLLRLMGDLLGGAGLDAAGTGGRQTPPDPGTALARSIQRRLRARGGDAQGSGLVALVHATAYADDFQVMHRLAACIESEGLRSVLAAPDHIRWEAGGKARHTPTGAPIDAIVRFYPAEWLPELGSIKQWGGLFGPGRRRGPAGRSAVLTNPATAVLVQSKRWPLVWDRLTTRLPTWRRLLPETRDPRDRATRDADWVLKPAMGRVGEGVLVPGVASKREREIRNAARRDHRAWVAQHRFESIPIPSPLGPLHVCLGVYVVDGRAAGLYARASLTPLIDQGAWEIPVLIRPRMPASAAGLAGHGELEAA